MTTEKALAELADYDAGLLNDYGGGDVAWWQDYLRAEIDRANEHWRSQVEALRARLGEPRCDCGANSDNRWPHHDECALNREQAQPKAAPGAVYRARGTYDRQCSVCGRGERDHIPKDAGPPACPQAALASQPGVPEGWVLVPVEPTREMCNAGDDAWDAQLLRRLEEKRTYPEPDTSQTCAAVAYAAMLTAAQKDGA